ncbi:MAG: L-threonylcarbamoyladenylate synthase [Elainellaceae cyanobacterium]
MPQVSCSQLISVAREGTGLVSFPTDTVPALATRPDRAEMIFETKQRSKTKPLILMGATAEDLWPYVQGSSEEITIWSNLVQEHWPGALTLVLPASDRIPTAMNPLSPDTLGIRVPNSAIARHILAQTGPLATTSVNRSGEPALMTLAAINATFPAILTLTPEELKELGQSFSESNDFTPSFGVPSTVVQWTTDGWIVLRQGSVALPLDE